MSTPSATRLLVTARSPLTTALLALAITALPPRLVAQRITVGPNVQISAARRLDAHSEPVIATDPKHPERILAASHIAWHDTVGTKSIAYASFDGG